VVAVLAVGDVVDGVLVDGVAAGLAAGAAVDGVGAAVVAGHEVVASLGVDVVEPA